jgi:hypothetical protein
MHEFGKWNALPTPMTQHLLRATCLGPAADAALCEHFLMPNRAPPTASGESAGQFNLDSKISKPTLRSTR